MKVTQRPPVNVAILVANSGNTAYGVDVITQLSYNINSSNRNYNSCRNIIQMKTVFDIQCADRNSPQRNNPDITTWISHSVMPLC